MRQPTVQAITLAFAGENHRPAPRLRNPQRLHFTLNSALIPDAAALSKAMCARLGDWPYWDCREERHGGGWFTLTGAVRHLQNPDPQWRFRHFLSSKGLMADFHYRALVTPRWEHGRIMVEIAIETYRPFGFWIMGLLLGPMVPFLWLALAIPLMVAAPGLLFLGGLLYHAQRQKRDPTGKPARQWRIFRGVTFLVLLFPLSIALGFEGRELPAQLFRQVFGARDGAAPDSDPLSPAAG